MTPVGVPAIQYRLSNFSSDAPESTYIGMSSTQSYHSSTSSTSATSASATSTGNTPLPQASSKSINIGAIIGGAIGALIIIGLIVLGVALFHFRNQRNNQGPWNT